MCRDMNIQAPPNLDLELERRQPDLLRRLIVITGTSGHPEYEDFLAETHVPFLEKPFSLTALQALTRQVLSAA